MSRSTALAVSAQRQTKPVEVVGRSKFDPAVLQRLTRGLEKEGRFAQRYVVQDDDDQADVAERTVEWKRLAKAVKAYYEGLARTHLDALSTLRELIKPYENLIALGLGAYTGALGTYEIEKAKRQRAALEAAKEAARARDSRALTRELNNVQDSKPQALRSEGGGSVSVAVVWQVDGQPDERELPRKWMLADVKGLNHYAAQYHPTERPVPISGVTFKLAAKPTVRT